MIGFGSSQRYFLDWGCAYMNKGFDSLCGIVSGQMGAIAFQATCTSSWTMDASASSR